MGCRSGARIATGAVWNNGLADSDAVFTPLVRLSVNVAARVRVSTLLQQATSTHVQIKPAIRYSDDGVTWDTPVAIGSYGNATTWQWGEEFLSTSSDARFAEVGVFTRYDTGGTTSFEFAQVTVKVEAQ